MEHKVSELIKLQSKSFQVGDTSSKPSLSDLFTERKGVYLNELTLYVTYFNAIPNLINEINIDCKKAKFWFVQEYKAEIKDVYFDKIYIGHKSKTKTEFDDFFCILFEDLIVNFDTACSVVRFLFRNTDFEKIIGEIKKFKKRNTKSKPEISLLVNSINGIETKVKRISKPKLNIEDNYNDDFKDVHETIIKRLSKKNDKGLVLLHGKPGTGKTSYIRYLISKIKKDVIFLPPNMANILTTNINNNLQISTDNNIMRN